MPERTLHHSRVVRGFTTQELATGLGLKPQTLRKRYSETGSYFSLVPVKCKNGRLHWPPDAFELLGLAGDGS